MSTKFQEWRESLLEARAAGGTHIPHVPIDDMLELLRLVDLWETFRELWEQGAPWPVSRRRAAESKEES